MDQFADPFLWRCQEVREESHTLKPPGNKNRPSIASESETRGWFSKQDTRAVINV